MEDMKLCQSCSMPLTDELYATNKDGSANEEYCIYCYKDGDFTYECTMEEMIEKCIPLTVENSDMDTETATKLLNEIIPQLKRWQK